MLPKEKCSLEIRNLLSCFDLNYEQGNLGKNISSYIDEAFILKVC